MPATEQARALPDLPSAEHPDDRQGGAANGPKPTITAAVIAVDSDRRVCPLWRKKCQRRNMADRAWFVATEIDLPWSGIAGTSELVEDLRAASGLDVEIAEPSGDLPYWRSGQ